MDNIFKQIIEGKAQSYIVYEDDIVLAILDIEPEAPGHTLILPKQDAVNIFDMDGATAGHTFKVAKKIAKALRKAFDYQDIKIFCNNGPHIQDIMYFHLHVTAPQRLHYYLDFVDKKDQHSKLLIDQKKLQNELHLHTN